MKKIIAFVLIFCLVLPCFSGCEEKDSHKIQVVTTVFPQFDFARIVGGDRVECEMLLPPGADSHSYSGDNPADILKIAECDLFIYTGGGDTEWVSAIGERLGDKAPVFLPLTDTAVTLDIEEEEEEHIHGEHCHHEIDEHVWTSPRNCMLIVREIRDILSELDPEGKETYFANAEEYLTELSSLDRDISDFSEGLREKVLVFADRFPFRYFAEEYGFSCYAAYDGCAAESDPAPSAIVDLCSRIEESSLSAVFYTETSSASVPRVIAEATGCEAVMLHSCHTVTEKQLKEGVSYISLMRENLEKLEVLK